MRQRLVGQRVREARPPWLKRVEGTAVLAVEPVGKHLLVRFEGGLVLRSHMRMTGSWHLYLLGQPWRRSERTVTVVLTFTDVVAVLFSAPVAELVHESRTGTEHLGPDILADTFDMDLVLRRARSLPGLELGELLLDQRVCAGIGNIFKCEALWACRLYPWRTVGDLDAAGLRRLFGTAREQMLASIAAGSRRRPRAAHGRRGRACPRCGVPIAVRRQGRELPRFTYFCPRCQAEGLPPRATRASVAP